MSYVVTTATNSLKNQNMATPYGSVSFEDGSAIVEDEDKAAFFRGNPHYSVSKNGAGVDLEGSPQSSWSVKQIKAYAEENGIDLGDAKNKGEYLAVIAAADEAPEEEAPEEDENNENNEDPEIDDDDIDPDDLED